MYAAGTKGFNRVSFGSTWRGSLNCTYEVLGTVPGGILGEAVTSEANVRGDEFPSINRFCPSYSLRPIPLFSLTYAYEPPVPWFLFPVMCVRQMPRSPAKPWLVQGDPEQLQWARTAREPPCHQQNRVWEQERGQTLTKLLDSKEMQSSRQIALALAVMGLNKIASSYYSHKQAASSFSSESLQASGGAYLISTEISWKQACVSCWAG